MKKILLLSTGGTIASVPSDEGYIPALNGEQLLEGLPQLHNYFEIDVKAVMKKDSTNMQPEDWIVLAENIYNELDDYQGIVITHGTDTMAYTASALTFMLQDINIPVVLTGSQIPQREKGSDAGKNMIDAFTTACQDIAGIFVVFNGKIIKGCRASKLKTKSFDAYESINHNLVGLVNKTRVEFIEKPGLPQRKTVKLNTKLRTAVFALKLIPGTNPEIFNAIIKMGYKAVIIESFSSGGLPFEGRNLLPYIKKMIENGIIVVISTQCRYEGVNLNTYEVGQKALKEGAIPAYDMTFEALTTKLMWALGNSNDINEVKKIMSTDYAGEVTIY